MCVFASLKFKLQCPARVPRYGKLGMVDCAKDRALCTQQGVQIGNYPHFWVYPRCHDSFVVQPELEDDVSDGAGKQEDGQQDGEQSEAEDREARLALECKTSKGKGERLFSAHEIAPHLAMPLMAKLLRNSIPLPVRVCHKV